MSKDFVDVERDCGVNCEGTHGMGAWAGEMLKRMKEEENDEEPTESEKKL